MRFSLGKKALMYEPMLVFFAIIILTSALYSLATAKEIETELGSASFDIISLEEESELKFLLAEQAALYSIYNSLNHLGENAGYSESQKEKCRTWNDCKVEKAKVKENLRVYLQNSFNKYALANDLNYYTIDITDEEGRLRFNFYAPNVKFEKDNAEYFLNHKFSKEINYNLDIYEFLYKKTISQIFENCDAVELHFNNLVCREEDKFLSFEYVPDKFYLNEDSFEYPEKLQPVIKFRTTKLIKIS
mgnify:CR=1 FL=1